MSQEMLIIGAVSISLVLLLLAIADSLFGGNRRMKKRLSKLRQRMGDEMPQLPTNPQQSVLKENKSASPGLDKILKQALPSSDVLTQRLARAGLEIGPGMYVGIALVFCLLIGSLLHVFVGLSLLVCILAGLGIGLGLAHYGVELFILRRKARFTQTFPDAIDLIVRAVKSGLPVTEGISIVSHEMEGPVSEEFGRISESMKIGETMDHALWAAAHRLDNAEFNFFVISLVVQSETGGNLAETLENLSDILRQRQTMKLKINALASEARASAYILGGLPFAMVAILEVLSPGYTQPLFTDDTGILLSIMALISISVGGLVMFKMVRFEI